MPAASPACYLEISHRFFRSYTHPYGWVCLHYICANLIALHERSRGDRLYLIKHLNGGTPCCYERHQSLKNETEKTSYGLIKTSYFLTPNDKVKAV